MFDAKEYLEAQEPPRFVAPDGTTYVGRILSHRQWLPLQRYVNELAALPNLTHERLYVAASRLASAMFPRTWRHPLRRTVAGWMKRLPPVAVLRALWDFMEAQAPSLGVTIPKLPDALGPKLHVEEDREEDARQQAIS